MCVGEREHERVHVRNGPLLQPGCANVGPDESFFYIESLLRGVFRPIVLANRPRGRGHRPARERAGGRGRGRGERGMERDRETETERDRRRQNAHQRLLPVRASPT